MRRTKVIATLGPATSTPERIGELVRAGMDVARLNFSHGTHEEHAANIQAVRSEAEKAGCPVAVLQDLQGPKIRTGELLGNKPVRLVDGQRFTITTEPIVGDNLRVATSFEALPHDVHPGDRILISDGRIDMRVIETSDHEVTCEILHGGLLNERQGITLPGVRVSAPAMTEKDIQDLRFGLEKDVDYIGVSFVRCASDVQQVKDLVAEAGKQVPVIAKLEKPEAVEDLDEILRVADSVMVARGDMGVEMMPERVPIVQKQIIGAANRAATPVITATEMLQSMIQNPRPTRAEVSDVANAVMDGSDAVMLSGETAIGRYPVEAVQMMARIAEYADAKRDSVVPKHEAQPVWFSSDVDSMAQAIGAAVSAIVDALPVRAVWVFTKSGSTARLVAHFRPRVPILAFTPIESTYRRLNLLWGVTPLQMDYLRSDAEYFDRIEELARTRGLGDEGDIVVMTGGHPIGQGGPSNFLKIVHLASSHSS